MQKPPSTQEIMHIPMDNLRLGRPATDPAVARYRPAQFRPGCRQRVCGYGVDCRATAQSGACRRAVAITSSPSGDTEGHPQALRHGQP
eukprot:355617-Chlamydomonas_euryale.AAC.8